MKALNYNSIIKVKLTGHGQSIYHDRYNSDVVIDSEGFSEFCLWKFMDIFGTAIGLSAIYEYVLEDGCIYIKDENLEDFDG